MRYGSLANENHKIQTKRENAAHTSPIRAKIFHAVNFSRKNTGVFQTK